MSPIAEHKCESLPMDYNVVKFYDQGWVIDMDEYRMFDILYCPFCGKRLE